MPNYNWLDFADRPAAFRYPDWVEGGELWREAAAGGQEGLDALLDRLIAARASAARAPRSADRVPRLFISHRWIDEPRARDVGALARAEGFEYWIDVEDPMFPGRVQPGPPYQPTPRELAVFIEIALLNCTHVIAVLTPNTAGSMWVPYEYGRIKGRTVTSSHVACWIDARLTGPPPEYLELGVKTATDAEIRKWLRQQLAAWGVGPSRHAGSTAASPPVKHPPADGSLGIDTLALPKAKFPKRKRRPFD